MSAAAKLHDIEMPNPVGFWPLAPGWIVLICCLVIAMIVFGYFARRYYLRFRIQRQALLVCQSLAAQFQSEGSNVCGALSVIMRRVTLAFHPKERLTLTGEDWLCFLKETSKPETWQEVDCRTLITAPYQSEAPAETLQIIEACKRWIKQQG